MKGSSNPGSLNIKPDIGLIPTQTISLVVVFQHANYSCEKILRLKPSLVSSALFCPFQLDLSVGV